MKSTIKLSAIGFLLILFASISAFAEKNVEINTEPLSAEFLLQQEPGKYGEDSATCLINLSLYREFYKQWRASGFTSKAVYDAYTPWRWVFFNCPQASQNTFVDGTNMVEYFLRKEKTIEAKDKYVDTLMMIYDQRIKYFGREGYVLGRKGSDLIKYRPDNYEDAYNIFKRSVEIQGNQSESFVVAYYFRSVARMVDEGKLDKGLIVEVYDQVDQIINFNLKANKNDAEATASWENVKGNIEVSFEPYATCEDLIAIYSEKFSDNQENIELLKKITSMLDSKSCTDSELFFQASVKLNELEPSPNSSLMIAKMLIRKEQFDESIPYLEDALKIDDDNTKADIFMLLSNVYRQQNNFPVARRYALQVLDLKPNNGNAYITIGDMYAFSAPDCGDNDLTKKVAYWAAVDKYIRARQVDPEVADIAQSRIATYSQQFPTSETIFFYDFEEGAEYTVGCWINEKTKVRALKQ
jgi:tetratricopeptide (TPR) repeat protein